MTPLASQKHKKRAAHAAAMGRKNKKIKTTEVTTVALTESSNTVDNTNIKKKKETTIFHLPME